MTDKYWKGMAENSAKELELALAKAIDETAVAVERFHDHCRRAAWDDDPGYAADEGLAKLGHALAGLVLWRAASEKEEG